MKIALISCVFVISLMLAYLAEWLPLLKSAKAIGIITKNSVNTIRSTQLDDNEKEKRLLANSWEIMWRSLYIIGLTLLVLIAGYLLIMLVDFFGMSNRQVVINYLETGQGVMVSLAAFLSYFLMRKIYVRIRL